MRVQAELTGGAMVHLPGRPSPGALTRERLLSADDGAMAEERWGRKVVVGRVCGKTACGGEGWRQQATGWSAESGDGEGAAAGKGPTAGGRAEASVQWPGYIGGGATSAGQKRRLPWFKHGGGRLPVKTATTTDLFWLPVKDGNGAGIFQKP